MNNSKDTNKWLKKIVDKKEEMHSCSGNQFQHKSSLVVKGSMHQQEGEQRKLENKEQLKC